MRALVAELDLPDVHAYFWAFVCGKPMVDAFGGGPFAIRKERDTEWVFAETAAERAVEQAEAEEGVAP